MLEDETINPGEMTSFNHYALGLVAAWLHGVMVNHILVEIAVIAENGHIHGTAVAIRALVHEEVWAY